MKAHRAATRHAASQHIEKTVTHISVRVYHYGYADARTHARADNWIKKRGQELNPGVTCYDSSLFTLVFLRFCSMNLHHTPCTTDGDLRAHYLSWPCGCDLLKGCRALFCCFLILRCRAFQKSFSFLPQVECAGSVLILTQTHRWIHSVIPLLRGGVKRYLTSLLASRSSVWVLPLALSSFYGPFLHWRSRCPAVNMVVCTKRSRARVPIGGQCVL